MEGPTMAMASSEERRDEPTKELVYKTKTIQFLGRTTPIILQNDNGPCPLLAICNVLLLRNHLSLNPDVTEVSQERLLSLVAERLIDSNSNVDNKDAGYVENQQQNIADAIDLLPRLTTGIDVNTKFRRIDDFEFTSECAIFDLLDIPLYHGWIVDPQDSETANAIGSKSYNALMGDLVELETRYMKEKQEKNSEGDAIDFVAATTATLGVPSPALSRGISFDEATQAASNHHDEVIREGDMKQEAEPLTSVKLSEPELVVPVNSSPIVDMSDQKHPCNSNEAEESKVFERSKEHSDIASQKNDDQGDMEHEAELLKAIKLSENDLGVAANNSPVVDSSDEQISADASEDLERKNSESVDIVEKLVACSKIESQKNDEQEPVPFQDSSNQVISSETDFRGSDCLNLKTNEHNLVDEPVRGDNVEEKSDKVGEHEDKQRDCNKVGVSDSSTQVDASTTSRQCVAEPETCSSSAPGGEPIYEGEECVLESDMNMCKDGEPMYEGEMVLAEQSCKGTKDYDGSCKDQLSSRQGKLIGKFFKNNASQLTIYGLFCLQDGLKQRELCVFFRNNHFNTMFKFDGELYILATDQGYISQPGLVWEKLNEVNGNSVFMTSNFKEFQVEDEINTNTWDEQNAMASTADYLASVDNSAHLDSSFNSDLQLAIALQQKEFEEQQQPQRNTQPSTVGSSRLITGPQVPRSSGKSSSSSVSPRQEAKSSSSKDKSCTVM